MTMSRTEINRPARNLEPPKPCSSAISAGRSRLRFATWCIRPTILFYAVCLAALLASRIDSMAAPKVSHFKLLTAPGTIGTLSVSEDGNTVDTNFRVDDNGRGPKLKEHIIVGPDGIPQLWEIEGNSDGGAPVKERFVVEAGRAKWTSLDDSGEAEAKAGFYVANNCGPWSLNFYLKALLAVESHTRAVLPGGTVRVEKIREVEIGAAQTRE